MLIFMRMACFVYDATPARTSRYTTRRVIAATPNNIALPFLQVKLPYSDFSDI